MTSEAGVSVPFGRRLQESVREHGPIVAGFDPHDALLEQWGLPNDASGAAAMCETMLDACAGRVAAIKPQSAFFECFGSAGLRVLEDLLLSARARGILTILDVKRGDIGSTMGAYARSYLEQGAPLEADAITVSPYLGFGSLEPCIPFVTEGGKGLFVLALTSNPDGPEVQHARTTTGESVAATVARHAARVNAEISRGDEWGSVGLVVGATIGDAAARTGVELSGFNGPLLAPGFGAQGAGPAQMAEVFGASASRVLVSMSRSILKTGPGVSDLMLNLDRAREEYASF